MTKTVVSCLMPGATFDRATQGLLGESGRVAQSLGLEHTVLVGASDQSIVDACVEHADRVVAITDAEYEQYHPEPCLAILHQACQQLQPHCVFLGQDTYSQEVSARLAHRLGGCSIGDAQHLDVSGDKLRAMRSVYGGKANAVIEANASPAVVWLRARAFSPQAPRGQAASVESRSFLNDDTRPASLSRTKVVDRQNEASDGVRLEDAQVIVSGGRGLGGTEPFDQLRDLAKVMNAQMAASRAACDSGWVPPTWQVGQTGKKVAPELYLAIAISGASQHLMGIADAKIVAAINTDPDAPIFRRCQIGLVEDWKAVVGPLTEALNNAKSA